MNAQQVIGQIHFCNLVSFISSDSINSISQQFQEELIGLIPALSLLYSCTSHCRCDGETTPEDYSSLSAILNVCFSVVHDV